MDLTAISGGIGAATQTLNLLKNIGEGIKATGKSEVIAQLIEAQLAMMDLLQKHQEALNQNQELRDRIKKLEAAIETKAQVKFLHEAYWTTLADGSLDGPFSPQQFDQFGKLVRMHYRGLAPSSDGIERHEFCCLTANKISEIPTKFLTDENAKVCPQLRGNSQKKSNPS